MLDRRRDKRFLSNISISLKYSDVEINIAHIVNISKTGILVRIDKEISAGKIVKYNIVFEDIEIKGSFRTIRRRKVEERDDYFYLAGMFVEKDKRVDILFSEQFREKHRTVLLYDEDCYNLKD